MTSAFHLGLGLLLAAVLVGSFDFGPQGLAFVGAIEIIYAGMVAVGRGLR